MAAGRIRWLEWPRRCGDFSDLMKPTLSQRIAGFFRGIVPTKKVAAFNPRSQITGVAAGATVETIHAALEQADAGNPRELFALYQEIVLGDAHLQGSFPIRRRIRCLERKNFRTFINTGSKHNRTETHINLHGR